MRMNQEEIYLESFSVWNGKFHDDIQNNWINSVSEMGNSRIMLIVIEQCYINDKKKRLMNFKKKTRIFSTFNLAKSLKTEIMSGIVTPGWLLVIWFKESHLNHQIHVNLMIHKLTTYSLGCYRVSNDKNKYNTSRLDFKWFSNDFKGIV